MQMFVFGEIFEEIIKSRIERDSESQEQKYFDTVVCFFLKNLRKRKKRIRNCTVLVVLSGD